jgi:hypothetical protein
MVQAAENRKEVADDRNLTPISEAPERWNLKSSAFYERLKYLGIQTIKQGRKSYLDDEQISRLDELDEYIQEHGSMEGFGDTNSNALVKAEENSLETNVQQPQPTVETQSYERNVGSEQQQMAQLIASAQNKAAGVLIAEGVLAQQFIANPEMLPEQLRTQIQEANAVPQIDPNAYAAQLLQQHQAAN